MGLIDIGVDLRQKRDPSAIAVAELEYRGPKEEDHWLIRHLERLPLGTPYPEVAERLGKVIDLARTKGYEKAHADAEAKARAEAARTGFPPVIPKVWAPSVRVYADATGVGQPVVDILKAAGQRATPCFFTHGDRRTVENGRVTIGKGYLVSRLQALLQTNRIHLPDTAEARALAQELLDYEIRVDEQANDRYGAFKVGRHDDLVTALGLAVQTKPQRWKAY